MVIAEIPVGVQFKVVKVRLGREVGKRLADMGFTEGAEGSVVRGGFLRGPLQVHIRGYDILIRRSEACAIEVSVPHAVIETMHFGRHGHHAGLGRRGWRGGRGGAA